ncbi:MAG: glycosyltransferase family 2 protein [Bacteroidetes bacterium]|nr:glycosyltransferase family 2 protein [Bacteroidota bacterium]
MLQASVVIIAKNEAHVIGNTLKSLSGLTDDIVVCDTGSTDNTIEVVKAAGCRAEQIPWSGFGNTKNNALGLAKYEWVLFLDADEAIDNELKNYLLTLDLKDTSVVYKIKFKNYFGNRLIRYGEWARECKTKLFSRKYTKWNDNEIHETVITPAGGKEKILEGYIIHQLIDNIKEYAEKINRYAELVAQKYYRDGKKAGFFKLYIYPCFQFLVNYFIRLSFLDGRLGFITSYFSSYYAFIKYHRLKELTINSRQ